MENQSNQEPCALTKGLVDAFLVILLFSFIIIPILSKTDKGTPPHNQARIKSSLEMFSNDKIPVDTTNQHQR